MAMSLNILCTTLLSLLILYTTLLSSQNRAFSTHLLDNLTLFTHCESPLTHPGRLLYIDLDTVITGNMDAIASYQGPFATLSTRGFENEQEYADGYNSSLMAWDAGFGHEVAHAFERLGKHIVDLCVSDQDYLEMMILNADLVQDIWPNLVREYKSECTEFVPPGTAIVTFPLIPKPHSYPSSWIADLWIE